MNGTAIHIEKLSVYYGRNVALRDVCLDVKHGEYLGIIRPNGDGKSTLLKVILGIIQPSSGKVLVYGKKPGSAGVRVGYVPQFALMDREFPITVSEVVLTGRMKAGLSPFFRYSGKDREAARELIEKVGLEGFAHRRISDLSGGEFQKMLIARALAVEPSLLLLDEPTASVDAGSRGQIFGLLDRLSRDMTVILVTHDLLAVSSEVHSLACLNGTLVYHGEPELNDNIVNSLYGCPVDLIAHGTPHRVLRPHEPFGGEVKRND